MEPQLNRKSNQDKTPSTIIDAESKYLSVKGGSYGFNDITNSVSTRSPFGRQDINFQRPNYALPVTFKDIVHTGRLYYLQDPLVRQVVDLQVDFVADGFSITYPDPLGQELIRKFLSKIGMDENVSEYAKHLVLEQNTVVRRITSNLTASARENLIELLSKQDETFSLHKKNKVGKKEIPVRYKFVDPTKLHKDDSGQLYYVVGESYFKNNLNTSSDILNNTKDSDIPELSKVKAVTINGQKMVPLDMEKIHVSSIKKDSWDEWSIPALYSVFSDIQIKKKLKQMEIAIIDGGANPIRLWKLGDHEHDYMPNPIEYETLNNLLQTNTGGGHFDLIWNSLIDCQEIYPPVKDMLDPTKFEQVDKDILIGLGVPEVLLGGKGANFSNSFIQLRTLIEKLEDVRSKIKKWIEGELKIICDVIGLEEKPIINFRNMIMYDENVYRQLVLQLSDRGLISSETVLEKFDENIEIEIERLKRDKDIFDDGDGDKLIKRGPFKTNSPESDVSDDQGGRPPNTKDVGTRNRSANVKASDLTKSMKTVDFVYDTITSWYLEKHNIKNARKLSSKQRNQIDSSITCVLSCINIIEDLDENKIIQKAEAPSIDKSYLQEFISELSSIKNPILQDKKNIHALMVSQNEI